MKVRVRVDTDRKKTIVVALPDEVDGQLPRLRVLRQQALCDLHLPSELNTSEAVALTLNGSDALSGDDTTLHDLGVVSGDLVLIQVSAVHSHMVQGHCGSTPQEKRHCAESAHSQPGAKEPVASSSPVEEENELLECPGSVGEGSEHEDLEKLSHRQVNEYLRQVMSVRDSDGGDVPDALRRVLEATSPQGPHDALVCVLHVLMVETGFKLMRNASDKSDTLPPGWRSPHLYRLQYTYSHVQDVTFELLGVTMQGVLVVYGSTSAESSKVQLKLKAKDYVSMDESGPVFKNLTRLSREFKDTISHSILQSVTRDTALAVPSLSTMFLEIKMYVLQHLDASSLLQLSETCQEFSDLCRAPSLWYRLFLKKFGRHREQGTDPNQDWYKHYKDQYRKMQETRMMFRQSIMVVPPYIDPRMSRPPPWVPPFGIGGDYDRDPGFQDPFGGRRGPDPLRFDPLGPVRPRFDLDRPAPNMFVPRAQHRGGGHGVQRPRTYTGMSPMFFK